MKLLAYRLATTVAGPLIRLYLARRRARGKEDPVRFNERLGYPSQPRPDGKLLWLHAASVGEALSILSLIERIRTAHPDWTVLVTTGTVTSARLLAGRLPWGALHHYIPVDRVAYVRRFLDHWRPDLAIWVESEFWPNLVIETHARHVPMVVLNGRMSEKSFRGWHRHLAFIHRILSAFALVLAQSPKDAERFCALGAAHVKTLGNLKYAAAALPVDGPALTSLRHAIGTRPLWLAASTHPGEEALCARVHKNLKTHHANVLSIVVPRHPERGEALAAELKALGVDVARRAAGQPISAQTDIYIADTLGELGLFYRLCDIVYMGKTLVGGGGQNPIEPAALSCALIFGPDMSNFEDIATTLVDAGASRWVKDEMEFFEAVDMLIRNPSARTHAGTAAATTAHAQSHVLDQTMNALEPFLSPSPPHPIKEAPHART